MLFPMVLVIFEDVVKQFVVVMVVMCLPLHFVLVWILNVLVI